MRAEDSSELAHGCVPASIDSCTARRLSAAACDAGSVSDFDLLCAQSHALHVERCAQSSEGHSDKNVSSARIRAMTRAFLFVVAGFVISVAAVVAACSHPSTIIWTAMMMLISLGELEAELSYQHDYSSSSVASESDYYCRALSFGTSAEGTVSVSRSERKD